jgi:hypothetical protein
MFSGNGATVRLFSLNGQTGAISWDGNTIYHAGNIPTWNQNTTGTASNITAYTINQSVGTSNSPTFAGLTVNTGGSGTWGQFVVNSTSLWGDGSTLYTTIGAGGAAGIMLYNPHIVWNSGNSCAGIRLGRSGGTSAGKYYEIGTGASDNFFIIKESLSAGTPQLNINSSGNATFSGTITASNFSGSHSGTSSGTNTGDQTNISGNAATVTNATFYRQFTVRDDRSDGNDYSLSARPTGLYAISSAGTNGPGSYWSSLIHVANGTDVAFQIAGGYNSDNMYFRGTTALQNGTGYSAWRTVIHSGNYSSYALPLSGGTMSGTLTLASISGTDQTVENTYGAYLHLGDWAVGRTATGAVLVNTAYRADYATDLFDMNISRFTNNSGYITSSGILITIQDTAPAGVAGKLWWESDTGKLKVYYGSAWVDASPIPDSSLFFAKAGGSITGDVSIGQTLNVVGNTLVQGTISAFGDVIAYSSSDARLKDNITVIESPLEKVSKINGVSFNWNDKQTAYEVGKKDIGVIAQEIEEVLPELVTTRDNGYKAVRYEKIVALLIEAVKEQQTQINNLTDKLNNL